ncbi:MAG: four helix bundle protein [Acidobacteria bacterium]|nr:four helix bundle protein [Acidobacteriota bacterium]
MARHFKELVAWQQADALRQAIWAVVRRTPGMDLKFRTQWTDAARSVCSNTAEGFGRRSHREFARFLELASSSLREIEDLVHEARMRGYLTDDNVTDLQRQVRRTSAPLARLLRYLRHNPDRR